MTDEEVEVVAAALAQAGGMAWHHGSEPNAITRVVADRYRDRARASIAALDRFRAGRDLGGSLDQESGRASEEVTTAYRQGQDISPGDSVIYRPPGDRRAYTCRVVELRGDRAYLTPVLGKNVGWVSIEHLKPPEGETSQNG